MLGKDEIFVLDAVINEVVKGDADAIDVCTYDKLPLLYLENEK